MLALTPLSLDQPQLQPQQQLFSGTVSNECTSILFNLSGYEQLLLGQLSPSVYLHGQQAPVPLSDSAQVITVYQAPTVQFSLSQAACPCNSTALTIGVSIVGGSPLPSTVGISFAGSSSTVQVLGEQRLVWNNSLLSQPQQQQQFFSVSFQQPPDGGSLTATLVALDNVLVNSSSGSMTLLMPSPVFSYRGGQVVYQNSSSNDASVVLDVQGCSPFPSVLNISSQLLTMQGCLNAPVACLQLGYLNTTLVVATGGPPAPSAAPPPSLPPSVPIYPPASSSTVSLPLSIVGVPQAAELRLALTLEALSNARVEPSQDESLFVFGIEQGHCPAGTSTVAEETPGTPSNGTVDGLLAMYLSSCCDDQHQRVRTQLDPPFLPQATAPPSSSTPSSTGAEANASSSSVYRLLLSNSAPWSFRQQLLFTLAEPTDVVLVAWSNCSSAAQQLVQVNGPTSQTLGLDVTGLSVACTLITLVMGKVSSSVAGEDAALTTGSAPGGKTASALLRDAVATGQGQEAAGAGTGVAGRRGLQQAPAAAGASSPATASSNSSPSNSSNRGIAPLAAPVSGLLPLPQPTSVPAPYYPKAQYTINVVPLSDWQTYALGALWYATSLLPVQDKAAAMAAKAQVPQGSAAAGLGLGQGPGQALAQVQTLLPLCGLPRALAAALALSPQELQAGAAAARGSTVGLVVAAIQGDAAALAALTALLPARGVSLTPFNHTGTRSLIVAPTGQGQSSASASSVPLLVEVLVNPLYSVSCAAGVFTLVPSTQLALLLSLDPQRAGLQTQPAQQQQQQQQSSSGGSQVQLAGSFTLAQAQASSNSSWLAAANCSAAAAALAKAATGLLNVSSGTVNASDVQRCVAAALLQVVRSIMTVTSRAQDGVSAATYRLLLSSSADEEALLSLAASAAAGGGSGSGGGGGSSSGGIGGSGGGNSTPAADASWPWLQGLGSTANVTGDGQDEDQDSGVDGSPYNALLQAALFSGWNASWPPAPSQSCLICSSGMFSSAADEPYCQLCPPGQYAQLPRSSGCQACAPGTFTTAWGTVACRSCIMGTYSSSPGSQYCQVCPAGVTSPGGASSCTIPAGQAPPASDGAQYLLVLTFGVAISAPAANFRALSAEGTGIDGDRDTILKLLLQADVAGFFNISSASVTVMALLQPSPNLVVCNMSATVPLRRLRATDGGGATGDGGAAGSSGATGAGGDTTAPGGGAGAANSDDLNGDQLVNSLLGSPDPFPQTSDATGGQMSVSVQAVQVISPLESGSPSRNLGLIIWPTVSGGLLLGLLVGLACMQRRGGGAHALSLSRCCGSCWRRPHFRSTSSSHNAAYEWWAVDGISAHRRTSSPDSSEAELARPHHHQSGVGGGLHHQGAGAAGTAQDGPEVQLQEVQQLPGGLVAARFRIKGSRPSNLDTLSLVDFETSDGHAAINPLYMSSGTGR